MLGGEDGGNILGLLAGSGGSRDLTFWMYYQSCVESLPLAGYFFIAFLGYNIHTIEFTSGKDFQ